MKYKYRLLGLMGIIMFGLAYFMLASGAVLAASLDNSDSKSSYQHQQPPNRHQPPHDRHWWSCPSNLRYGDQGHDVRKLERALNNYGYRGPNRSWLVVDGSFGPDTLHAVKQLQRRNNLYADGRVGERVWRILGECRWR